MQFSRYLTYSKKESTNRYWPWIVKLFLAVASFYYMLSKLLNEKGLFEKLLVQFSAEFGWLLLVVVVLMGVNWWLEILKWQLLAKSHQPLSFFKALKAVISGVSLDSILPLGMGAVAGKVLSMKERSSRDNLIVPVIAVQGIQSFWTISFGMIGLWQLTQMTNTSELYGMNSKQLVLLGLVAFALVVAYLLWPQAVRKWGQSIQQVSLHSWLVLAGLSFVRYLIFLIQLLLLSHFFTDEIPMSVLIGCSTWMFFAKTIVPKPGHLGALGIRGASVVFFLNLGGYPYTGFVFATFLLWFINLAIPSLVGVFFIRELHLSTKVK